MTEIFYRLLSQANGDLLLLDREERLNCIRSIVKEYSQDDQRSALELKILGNTDTILDEFHKIDFALAENQLSAQYRRDLAMKCLNVRMDVFKLVENRTQGIDYKSITNEEFARLIQSDLTKYFYIALFISECRGKLMEFLLVHKY